MAESYMTEKGGVSLLWLGYQYILWFIQ